jgi:antitoxin component YwqK of YwqJK toxin-antitoxin module
MAAGQGITRFTYHDPGKKSLKEIYQVKDTIQNILNGRYISYYLNGNVESKGQFVNNETAGVWEFYYETGNKRMRGVLRQNSNYGMWEFFFENGQKSMEGTINGKNREGEWKIYYESGELKEMGMYEENKRVGLWKTYFEDGAIRGEIEYADDNGRFTEYYHSGKVMAEGPKNGSKNVGHWRYFAEDGTLESEGEYVNGKKSGTWKYYYNTGKLASEGLYENGETVGPWVYYYEDGNVSSKGEFLGGKKSGYWSVFAQDGSIRSEITYQNGSGEYREYFPGKKLKVKGFVLDGKNQGRWEYYTEDGKLEGECEFEKGKGTYLGYYPNGSLQTRGQIEDDKRIGTWELFEPDGKLSGYYRPIYEDQSMASAINSLLNRPKIPAAPTARNSRKGFYYFTPRFPEYRGVIIEGNPMMSFVGSMPLAIEFYNEERLGHEFEFEGIREPFFAADDRVPQNKIFKRGYAIALREKFYNAFAYGMWYFSHELRFTNIGHFTNVEFNSGRNIVTASASEQRAEYGVLIGSRLMKDNGGDGFTIDGYLGYGIGYRNFDVDPIYRSIFANVNQRHLVQTFRFGLNFGFAMSFDKRK